VKATTRRAGARRREQSPTRRFSRWSRARVVAALVLAGALACLPAASAAAQTAVVQAVDDTTGDGTGNRWSPGELSVKAGESVTWRFAGTAVAHNVKSDSANWTFQNTIAVGGPDAAYTFTTPGYYTFICQLHPGPMHGTVTVTDGTGEPPPPPPPPPLGEQPFPNDQPAPTVFELRDRNAPQLTDVSITGRVRAARVRFRLSEPANATISVTRGARIVQVRRFSASAGANDVTVRGLPAGRYQVELRVRDLAGNQAPPRRARVTVRS
jgi:plastocyanin